MQLRNRFITDPGLLSLDHLHRRVFYRGFRIATSARTIATASRSSRANYSPRQKPNEQETEPSQPDQPAGKAVVVTGTIVKSGDNFVLQDTSGTVYQLDAQDKAQPYEGKSVKETGKLEAESKLLHVDTIEELNA